MIHQAPNGAQNRRLSSVLSTSAKASALACLAFALAPNLVHAAAAAAPAPAATTAAAATGKIGTVYGKVTNAATGSVMSRAKVSVEGTDIETFSDEFGEYRLELPEGSVNIKVSYTGMKDKILDVEVMGGEIMMQDFNIVGMSVASTGKGKDEVVTLEAFSVSEGRETNAYNIANNEQRYSVNIKSVVAADAFGDVTEGNVGEFIKYLPGISVDYVAADVRTINVRGFASQFTNISFNGMRVTSAASGSNSRVIELEQISINNVARAEVTKVPTADQPSDTLGGNVNLISKNSFERKGVSFNWKAYTSLNSEDLTFRKTPGPRDAGSYKILPGFDFDLTIPFTKNFGIVLTGLSSNQFNEQHRSQMVWQFNQAATTDVVSTPSAPTLNNYEFQDGPKVTSRNSFNLRADWRIAPGHTLNIGYQNNFYNSFFGNRNVRFTVGTVLLGKATAINGIVPTTVTNLDANGSLYQQSATGGGSVTQGSSYRNKNGQTQAADIFYRMKRGDWEADAGIHGAISRSWYRDLGRGFFNNIGTTMLNVSTTRVENISYPAPLTLIAKNQTGGVINYSDLNNYQLKSATSGELDGRATMKGAFADVKRTFDVSFPLGVKTGVAVREESRDNHNYTRTYNYVGADHVAGTADDGAGQYASKSYVNQDTYWGLPNIAWVSPTALYDTWVAHPDYLALPNGGGDAYKAMVQASVYIKERVSATYMMFDGKFLHNKLSVSTGVRFEKTEDSGQGMLFTPDTIYQRDASGKFIYQKNTDGSIFVDSKTKLPVRLRKAEAGVANSLEQVKMQYFERGYKSDKSYDGYYPSLSASYNITENLIARFAYAKTYGRPDYADIIPSVTIPEPTMKTVTGTGGVVTAVDEVPGIITVSNTGLQPWQANNFDLALEYYHSKGGSVSAGIFRKDLQNFWGTKTLALDGNEALAEEFGIDYAAYQKWQIQSKFNVGNARIDGMEINIVQPLSNFGEWGKSFNVTANSTVLSLQGPNGADFSNFITKTGNVGVTYSKKGFVVMLKLNMRGKQRFLPQTGTAYVRAKLATETDADYSNYIDQRGGTIYEYYRSRNTLDLNLEYQFSKRIGVFANVRNLLNKSQDLIRTNDATPLYAQQYRTEEYGLQWAVGVKGKF